MKRSTPIILPLAALAGAATVFQGCEPGPQQQAQPDPPPPKIELRASAETSARDAQVKQLEFLNRIREADPDKRTIEKALLNEQNELGLILNRSVEMETIPALMKTMLTEMSKEFPGQDLTVIAYAPSSPPMKIGTARLDAQTREMTYTAETPKSEHRPPAQASAQDARVKQLEFLNRIREADPDKRTIEKALLNEQNELGLILNRSVEMETIPALMKTMLTELSKEFPGQDLTVIAYAPSNPPMKIGTARLDVQTREITYTAE
jgi:hypothetical protein